MAGEDFDEDEVGTRPTLPRTYAHTPLYLALRVAERFGVRDPIDWWDSLSPAEQATLTSYELLREQEQYREDVR